MKSNAFPSEPLIIRRKEISLTAFIAVLLLLIVFMPLLIQPVSAEDGIRSITFHYSGADKEQQTITIDFADEWLLQSEDIYNHKLMQASFGMAVAAFRDKEKDLSQKDYNILDFFSQLGFTDPRTEDFNIKTSINTIGTAIAHKKIGDSEVIAVSVSGNNYHNEWQSNLTVDDENRPVGFNAAANKVWHRVENYIGDNHLSGNLRLWISGYSRAAAVSNITAADAVDSGLFDAVYGYTIGTPRTTKDENAGKYSSIFNIINPFDPVPLVPYPEWGFFRYGTDLFLPSMETDSDYAVKKVRADEYLMEAKGHPLHYNPHVNSQLHTFQDMSLFFVSSSRSYRDTYQAEFLEFWQNRDAKALFFNIISKIQNLPEITSYQIFQFREMLDYLMQITFTNWRLQKGWLSDGYWDRSLSLQENLMHEHFDEVYRSWLFSSDDPGEIFMNDPRYSHFSFYGKADMEVYDANDRFVLRIDQNGNKSADPRDSQWFAETEIIPEASPVTLFVSRLDDQTLIAIPMDQEYSVVLFSHQNEPIQCAYVEYSAKKLRGEVQYILNEEVEKGDLFWGNVDPEMISGLTEEEMIAIGVRKIEPWSREIVYDASAVMRIENTGIFHPSPLIFLTFGGLLLFFAVFILIISAIGAGMVVKKGVGMIRNRRNVRKAETDECEKISDLK